jgi:hypothetical protein
MLALLCFFALLLGLALTTTVAAQDVTPPPAPTSEFDFNVQEARPTIPRPVETINPQMLPSLTGVNGQAVNAAVIIRSGPGLDYARVGALAQGGWIDIVGWNGWPEDRVCSAQFRRDLDMWVQVQRGEQRGWVARCVLDIRGDVTNLPIVDAAGDRELQR